MKGLAQSSYSVQNGWGDHEDQRPTGGICFRRQGDPTEASLSIASQGNKREDLPGSCSQSPARSQGRQLLAKGRPVPSEGPEERWFQVAGMDGGLLNDAEKIQAVRRSMTSGRDQETEESGRG